MRQASEIPMLEGYPQIVHPADMNEVRLEVPLQLPGLALVHICEDLGAAPNPPTEVRLHETTTPSPREILVTWSDSAMNTRCVRSYIVYLRNERINPTDTIFTGFMHAAAPAGPLCYSVSAVDYFGREGGRSKEVCL